MPTTTFFNLPPEKREKLLRCARAEFARAPFADASVNRIIRAAGIPRGSFYQYFRDKGDLFRYLLGQLGEKLVAIMENLLDRREGDLFAALLDLFDRVQAECRNPATRPIYEDMIEIAGRNPDLGKTLFTPDGAQGRELQRLCTRVDGKLLDLRSDRDLEDILRILAGVTGPAIINSVLTDDPAEVRRTYINSLDLLSRGMTHRK